MIRYNQLLARLELANLTPNQRSRPSPPVQHLRACEKERRSETPPYAILHKEQSKPLSAAIMLCSSARTLQPLPNRY